MFTVNYFFFNLLTVVIGQYRRYFAELILFRDKTR